MASASAALRFAARWLLGRGVCDRFRNRGGNRIAGQDGQLVPVVAQLHTYVIGLRIGWRCLAVRVVGGCRALCSRGELRYRVRLWISVKRGLRGKRVRGLIFAYLDRQDPAVQEQPEAHPIPAGGQPRREVQAVFPVPHPAEPGHQSDPAARERGQMQAVGGVLLQVVDVHQRGFAEIVVREPQMPDLGRDDRLAARRQGRVAHRQRFAVLEVPRLVPMIEGVAAQVQRQHQVRLLDHLLAVQLEVGEVQQQRVLARLRVLEVPELVLGEALGLWVHPARLVVGDEHALRRGAPVVHLVRGSNTMNVYIKILLKMR